LKSILGEYGAAGCVAVEVGAAAAGCSEDIHGAGIWGEEGVYGERERDFVLVSEYWVVAFSISTGRAVEVALRTDIPAEIVNRSEASWRTGAMEVAEDVGCDVWEGEEWIAGKGVYLALGVFRQVRYSLTVFKAAVVVALVSLILFKKEMRFLTSGIG
jgi:hypothetical protein